MDRSPRLVWHPVGLPSAPGAASLETRAVKISHLYRAGRNPVIILFNPRSTKPRNRRFPLSVMALAPVLEGRGGYQIVDGNVDENPTQTILDLIHDHHVQLLGVTVMPGPQMVSAMEVSRTIRNLVPKLPIVWGGYFPSIYSDAALNARYVDYVVRG